MKKTADCAVCFGSLELVVIPESPPFWRHVIGMGVIMQRCWSCGHFESSMTPIQRCPRCGSKRKWVFDHVAKPVPELVVVAALG